MNKFYFFLLFTITSFSQDLLIIDENKKPVIGASVFSDVSNFETTDKNGFVSLNKFSNKDTLTINQYGFKEQKLIKSKLNESLILIYDNELLDIALVPSNLLMLFSAK